MGICVSEHARAQNTISKTIDLQLKQDFPTTAGCIKLLLLGSGESGKSTVLKQMRILCVSSYSQDELREFSAIVYSNILASIHALCQAMQQLRIQFDDSTMSEHYRLIEERVNTEEGKPLGELYQAVKALWLDLGVQRCYEMRAKFQLNDSAKYLLDNLDRICAGNYVPTESDVIRVRATTTGVTEMLFSNKGLMFRVIDVGGQKSERRKWFHQFECVTTIIFIVAVSEYDQKLREDGETNRMVDAIELFRTTINNDWFRKKDAILFLNKKDLFEEKIQRVSLTAAFPDYKGKQEHESCMEYIRDHFVSLDETENRFIRPHETCATDKDQIQVVINNLVEKLIQKNLRQVV